MRLGISAALQHTTPEEWARHLEEVKRDRFAVHMDIINMINTPERYFYHVEFMERCFSILGDRIKSCHMKDIWLKQEFTFQLEECACGEGVFSLERYCELAEKANTQMPVLLEHLPCDEDYIASMKYVTGRFGKKQKEVSL